MAPECSTQCSGSHPEIMQFQKQPTQDIYSFGLVTYQIAANGAVPYQDASDVLGAKAADLELKALLKLLPKDTPTMFRSIIVQTTKIMPPERVSLEAINQMLKIHTSSNWHLDSERYEQAKARLNILV